MTLASSLTRSLSWDQRVGLTSKTPSLRNLLSSSDRDTFILIKTVKRRIVMTKARKANTSTVTSTSTSARLLIRKKLIRKFLPKHQLKRQKQSESLSRLRKPESPRKIVPKSKISQSKRLELLENELSKFPLKIPVFTACYDHDGPTFSDDH